jgi:hypothetical protein
VVHFDGQEYALFIPQRGNVVYAYDVLLSYLGLALRTDMPVSTFLKTLMATLKSVGCSVIGFPIASDFYSALRGFTRLLDLERHPGATMCLTCNGEPKTLLMDATSATISCVNSLSSVLCTAPDSHACQAFTRRRYVDGARRESFTAFCRIHCEVRTLVDAQLR